MWPRPNQTSSDFKDNHCGLCVVESRDIDHKLSRLCCFLKGPEKRKLSEGKEDSFLDKRSWLYVGHTGGRLRPRAAAVVVVFDEAALLEDVLFFQI